MEQNTNTLQPEKIEEQFLIVFLQTAQEMLKELHEKSIMLESSPESFDAIDSLFRTFHTLKGNSSFLGLINIKTVAHALEDLLSGARSKTYLVDKTFIDMLWEGIGILGKDIEKVKNAQGAQQEVGEEESNFIAKLRDKITQYKLCQSRASIPVRATDMVRYLYGETDISRSVFIIKAYLEKSKAPGTQSDITQQFIATLADLKDVFSSKKDVERTNLVSRMIIDFEMLVDDSGSFDAFLLDTLTDSFSKVLLGINKVEIDKTKSADNNVEKENKKASFRVEESNINELVKSVNKLEKVGNSFYGLRDKLSQVDISSDIRLHMQEAMNNLNYLCQDMFQILIRIKLVSPDAFLEKNKRLVEALSKSCNKKVNIQTESKNIFVERRNLELLDSIFIHILRNSIDHGIELPEERIANGKPEEGNVKIVLTEDGKNLILRLSDDGRGINFKALREASYKKGKISFEEMSVLSDEESSRLIFLPGVSTSESVTDISGRGVGMDVVMNSVEKASGTIKVSSETGKGTTFEIMLPLNINI